MSQRGATRLAKVFLWYLDVARIPRVLYSHLYDADCGWIDMSFIPVQRRHRGKRDRDVLVAA